MYVPFCSVSKIQKITQCRRSAFRSQNFCALDLTSKMKNIFRNEWTRPSLSLSQEQTGAHREKHADDALSWTSCGTLIALAAAKNGIEANGVILISLPDISIVFHLTHRNGWMEDGQSILIGVQFYPHTLCCCCCSALCSAAVCVCVCVCALNKTKDEKDESTRHSHWTINFSSV